MREAQTITKQQINNWLEQLNNGTLAEIGVIYDALASYGYHYASWAKGVATGTQITGQGALQFMQKIYQDKHHGTTLTQTQIDKVRRDMAKA